MLLHKESQIKEQFKKGAMVYKTFILRIMCYCYYIIPFQCRNLTLLTDNTTCKYPYAEDEASSHKSTDIPAMVYFNHLIPVQGNGWFLPPLAGK